MTRSMTLARLGKTSLICRPGTEVAIGLNSPRTSTAAPGLGSNVSMCEGPPASQIRMQFLTFADSPDFDARHGPKPEPVIEPQPEKAQ